MDYRRPPFLNVTPFSYFKHGIINIKVIILLPYIYIMWEALYFKMVEYFMSTSVYKGYNLIL